MKNIHRLSRYLSLYIIVILIPIIAIPGLTGCNDKQRDESLTSTITNTTTVTVLIPEQIPTIIDTPEQTPITTPSTDTTIQPQSISKTVRLNMKSYGNHTPAYDSIILSILPEYVIDNPPHGLYGEMFGYNDPSLLQNVAEYQQAGIKVIGYISSGYEGKGGGDNYTPEYYSLNFNEKLIKNMAEIDHVDGVFIDELDDYPNQEEKQYIVSLTRLANSYGLIIWGNVGVDDFDSWYLTEGGFHLMQSTEAWIGQPLSPVQKKYGSQISVTGFNKDYTLDDALRLTYDAWSDGLAYCYINNAEYESIAPWFTQYANILRDNQNNFPLKLK